MKTIQPQPMCEEMSSNNADRLEYVRDTLAELQGNIAWIQQEVRDGMTSLAVRGLILEFEELMGNIALIQAVINKA